MSFTRISFDVTSACNLSCKHCLRLDRHNPTHLPVDVFEKAIEQCGRYGTRSVIFTGGEPFMHPRILEMVDIVARNKLHYYIVTNGVKKERLAELIKDKERKKCLTGISLSIEGATEQTNDKIRGEGVYRKVMATTAFLKSNEVSVAWKMSVNKLNVHEVEQIAVEAVKMGAETVEYSHMHPTPDLVRNDMILPREKWRDVDHQVMRLSRMLKLHVVMCAGGYSPLAFYQCSSMQMGDAHVDCHGNLAVCCILPYFTAGDGNDNNVIGGNLAEMDLWDAHKRLVSIIAGLNQGKIRKIKEGTFGEIDYYPCMYCLRYFNKLKWLKELAPDNEWVCE